MAGGLTFREATPDDVPAIVRFVDSVLNETAAQKASLLDDSFYRWQYDVQRDVIVIAEEAGEILAHYPLVAYPMRWGKRTVQVGVCQDLSVSDRLRGRGVFKQMGLLANDLAAAKGIDLLFAFPNHRSISGFLKHHGYSLVGEVGWFATVIDPTQGLPLKALKRLGHALFGGNGPKEPPTAGPWDVGPLADSAVPTTCLGTSRTNEYLDWRFAQRPNTDYVGLVEQENGQPVAWAALRVQELKGLRVGLIMDLAVTPGADAATGRLLARCRAYFRAQGAALAFMVATPGVPAIASLRRAGYLPIPNRFAPRHLNLVARAVNPACEPLVKDLAAWHLTFADWDVF